MDSRCSPLCRVVPASAETADALAANLRREHVREIADTSGLPPREALLLSLFSSVEAYTLLHRTKGPLFMMGVEAAGVLTGAAMVWMVGSMEMDEHPRAVLRTAMWGLRRAFAVSGADCLEQYIPAWYRTGVRFAAHLGFSLYPESEDAGRARSGAELLHAVLWRDNAAVRERL